MFSLGYGEFDCAAVVHRKFRPQRQWHSDNSDLRSVPEVESEVKAFIKEYEVLSVSMVDRVIGCPHEEGVNPNGESCPQCPFWRGRDRFTGELIN